MIGTLVGIIFTLIIVLWWGVIMREFWTWVAIVLIVVLLALGFLFRPAHAEPAGTFPTACMSSARLTAMLEELGAKTWPIEGLRAVRFLSIVNHIDPPTDYRAESVISVFPPEGETMGVYLINAGCAGKERISLPVKAAMAIMLETFERGDVRVTLIHDQWSDGEPVPPWVKKACCGPEDVHHLRLEQVHNMADGVHVDGLSTVIPYSKVLPSPDGQYWGFWSPIAKDPTVYCFFAPIEGS